ncbi:MAG: arginine deiminase-related protein [Paludibacter sp.]|nr:arginine deiminase-related protein [Paludibacter sp.]
MEKQNAKTVLMIEPVAFGYNAETAVNNFFQQQADIHPTQIQQFALDEFNEMVKQLQTKGIEVIVVKDTLEPHTPDSIFPNNWVSFHEEGCMVIYPVFAMNRRMERCINIIQKINESGFQHSKSYDYSPFENKNQFLEGTGSMVLDRVNKITYAALSERTSNKMLLRFCGDFGYFPVVFNAFQTVGNRRLPIYHTNVMLCIADKYAVICIDSIDKIEEREKIINSILQSGKTIIDITEKQMSSFAGNMLQLQNKKGEKLLVMSASAFQSLENNQINNLRSFNELVIIPVPIIEKYGGGSVRCMMAEVF